MMAAIATVSTVPAYVGAFARRAWDKRFSSAG